MIRGQRSQDLPFAQEPCDGYWASNFDHTNPLLAGSGTAHMVPGPRNVDQVISMVESPSSNRQ
jgi:hypothetical protein